MASDVEICNRALQRLGDSRIVLLTDDTKRARACNAAYAVLRDRTLRAHPWNFAIVRASLPADAIAPVHGPINQFTLPADCLRLLQPDPWRNMIALDWQIEGRKITTNETAPLLVRYISRVTDPNLMDVLYREALACVIAFEICEEITQSNTKKESIRLDLRAIIAEAKLTNAIENNPADPPDDPWITARL